MMTVTTVAEMTLEELRHFIDERIEVNSHLYALETDDTDWKAFEQVRTTLKSRRWTPPPGTPSVDELIREDRKR